MIGEFCRGCKGWIRDIGRNIPNPSQRGWLDLLSNRPVAWIGKSPNGRFEVPLRASATDDYGWVAIGRGWLLLVFLVTLIFIISASILTQGTCTPLNNAHAGHTQMRGSDAVEHL